MKAWVRMAEESETKLKSIEKPLKTAKKMIAKTHHKNPSKKVRERGYQTINLLGKNSAKQAIFTVSKGLLTDSSH